MAKATLYLDTRTLKKDGTAPLKVILRNRGTMAYLSLGISLPPECWDGEKVILSKTKSKDDMLSAKPKTLNLSIRNQIAQIELLIHEICGLKSNMPAPVLRDKILTRLYGPENEAKSFIACYDEYLASLQKESSRTTLRCAKAFILKWAKRVDTLKLEDITEEWVEKFVNAMRTGTAHTRPLAPNTVWAYYNTVKIVFHYAQKKGLVAKSLDPFENITVSKVATKSRALLVEEARELWNYAPDKKNDLGRDMFRLIFCLCGLNIADLHDLKDTDIRNGRLETDRQKTGVHINIRIEPEAAEIIQRYSRNGYLIGKIRSTRSTATGGKINYYLEKMRPGLTVYWIRHTWASLAVELDIPDRTVFMGLAHKHGKLSDETYITMRNKKLDAANRKVIDYVLGKISGSEG